MKQVLEKMNKSIQTLPSDFPDKYLRQHDPVIDKEIG